MTPLNAATQFVNVLVKVKPGPTKGSYIFETAPAIPYVTQPDTVINYQLYDTCGHDIVFSGMSIKANDQLSDYSLSKSQMLLTLNDAVTKKVTLDINLQFHNRTTGDKFSHDPQVQNEPQQ
jgi:hypothetical protein